MKVQDMAQNLYSDTRGQSERPVTFTEAVIDGLAAGGGLYVPERIPELSLDEIGALAELPYAQRAARIYRAFDVDLPAETVEALMAQAYGDNFDDERICPITSLSADTHVLELWHGPTSAFKDMALQCLPRFFSASAAQLREQGKLDHDFLILVATSGDTGKAALEGFRDVDGVSIGVMYPDGGVSDIQFKQMATQRGRNVQVWGVRGNFDDCQTGAKNVFGDEAFAKKLQDEHRIALSSANSINWGRLMPQIVYYVSAYAQLAADGKLNLGDELDVCVPTGNFGNILAAYYAKRMGVPLGMLYCASNENRVLTDFINTGTYDISERPFVLTPSPSMDILVSSNLERLLYLSCGRDAAKTKAMMEQLSTNGKYEITADMKEFMKDFCAGYADMEENLFVPLKKGEITAANAAALSGKLLQMANGAVYSDDGDELVIHDQKLDALEDMIEAANGRPVMVAYWFKHDLSRIMRRLTEKKIPFEKLDSEESIRKWNRGELPVALIHPASAGHGLNLQSGGNTLIWFGLTWSLELYQQTVARLWRQGQTAETVVVQHIITAGTIDEDVMKALANKDMTQNRLIAAVKARVTHGR